MDFNDLLQNPYFKSARELSDGSLTTTYVITFKGLFVNCLTYMTVERRLLLEFQFSKKFKLD